MTLEQKSDAIQRLWKERDELRAESVALRSLNRELVNALYAMLYDVDRVAACKRASDVLATIEDKR